MRSLAGSFSLVCSFYALTRLPIGDVLTLTNTYPLWILVLSWLALREMPRGVELLGVASGLAGVVLIEQPHLDGDNLAAVVALLSSFSTAVAMIGLHRLRAHRYPRRGGALRRAWRAVVAVVCLVARGRRWGRRPPPSCPRSTRSPWRCSWGWVRPGTLGQIFLTKAYAAGAAARVAVLGLTQVVFAIGFDVVLWHRTVLARLARGHRAGARPHRLAAPPRGVVRTPAAVEIAPRPCAVKNYLDIGTRSARIVG